MNQTPIVDPTREQQLTLRGLIYGIRHKETGMFYIGQTINTFRKRYMGGKWWRRRGNAYLRNAVLKYGTESFEIWILEHSIECPKRRDELEEYHANARNAYAPSGFNFLPCGFTGKAKAQRKYADAIARMKAKTWRVKELATGVIHDVTNLSQFCRERDLDVRNLHKILTVSGRGATSQGFALPETTDDDIANLGCYRNGKVPYGPYTIWKDGISHDFGNIKAFVRFNKSAAQGLCRLLRGDVSHWQGFTLQNAPRLRRAQVYTDIRLRDRDGNERVFTSAHEAHTCLGAHSSHIHGLMRGERKSCKGYTFVSARRLKESCPNSSPELAVAS